MRFVFVLLVFVSSFAGPVLANTPPEVLAAFKAYQLAAKNGDRDSAIKHAEEAYTLAQEQLGDAEITGVLAHNYAGLIISSDKRLGIKLFKEAIKLTDDTVESGKQLNAQRYISIAEARIRPDEKGRVDTRDLMNSSIRQALNYMEKSGLQQSTFGAEAMTLDAIRLVSLGRHDDAIKQIDAAVAIFESPQHTVPSYYKFEAHILRGDIFDVDDDPIEAALSYQTVMQNLEGDIPSDHPFIEKAFYRWLKARSQIEEKNIVADADQAGVCKCWPYDEMSAKAPVPLERVPPLMPRTARKSGRVIVKFDVNQQGEAINIEAQAATEKRFIKPALKSVQKWRYEISEDLTDEDLKGIVTTIRFKLFDPRGHVLSEPPLQKLAEL